MSDRILLGGTDGFRGPATRKRGPGLINEETFALLTYSLVERQLELGEKGPVVIGQDTRESGKRLRQAAIIGALMHGVEVWDLDIAPTPTLQKISKEHRGLATIAITASHNTHEDNGWKGMLGIEKPSKDIVADISERYWRHVEGGPAILKRKARLKLPPKTELKDWYSTEVTGDIESEFGEKPLDGKLFVIDGAHGAAQSMTADIFRQLGARVEEYSCDMSGRINEGCGAADLSGLKKFLAQHSDITANPDFIGALANDGDADRVIALGLIREKDELQLVEVNGNHLMGSHALGQPGIVGTEYTNSGLVCTLKDEGIDFEYCANGDYYVTQQLRQKQSAGEAWTRGGEFTGHHIDTNWLPSGDGIRMAAWFAAFTVSLGLNFGEIYKGLPLWPEKMAKVRLPESKSGDAVLESSAVRAALLQATMILGDNGRLVVRPSGTEPVIRIWGEGKQAAKINRVVDQLQTVVRAHLINRSHTETRPT